MLIEKIQIRLSKLKQILDECPLYEGENEEIKQILNEAPQLLQMAEQAIQSGNPVALEQIGEVLEQAEIDIKWAAGVSKGDQTAQRIREGRTASPDLPARERLLDRLLQFTTTIVDRDTYLELFQEFGGEVDGNRAYMDPGEETEAFSQWLLYDKVIPGQSNVIIYLFADKEMDSLPSDEQALLKGYLKNWPSVFEVADINKKKNIYTVNDLLSGKKLKFRDKASSKLLKPRTIFLARAIPFNMGKNLYYPLGEILELPPKLWKTLSQNINGWAKEYYSVNPGGSSKQLFRSINAKLRRYILDVTHNGSGHTNDDSVALSEKQKTVKEIDSFVKQFKQNHKDINEIIGHPDILTFMTKFKGIMDESRPEELDFLCSEHDGFYEFALFLENFASVIQEGGMNDLL
ncbi:MAG: hypothetical protein SVO01_13075 [Thermotogota bacterium]|nr:hypothetical protein [Thermotogota bacterium]